MKDLAELLGIVLILIGVVLGVVLLATLPFAFIGWAITTIIGLFMILTASYFDCVAVGIGVAIIASIVAKAKTK
jgi:hypothetical protein